MKTKYWKVTTKKLTAVFDDWQERFDESIEDFLRFSRRHGGSRKRYGASISFGQLSCSIYFSKEPDRKLWKERNGFWQPKRSGKAKPIRKEFDILVNAIPSTSELMKAVSMSQDMEFIDGGLYGPHLGKFRVDGVWYVGTRESFKGAAGLKRVSDVAIEKLIAKSKAGE